MDGAREVAWAVTRAGCGRGQVAGDFSALVSEVEAAWANLFPRRLGYCTRTELISDHVVRLEVRRGDFEGHVELCCDYDRRDAGRIRAVASARSQRMAEAEAAGQRIIRRARGVATAVGALMCVGFCWLAAGVHMPVVGGLMLSIITACLLVGGGNLGARVGEVVAGWRMLRAERAVLADIGVQADIRRWNSLNRQLRGHRRALARGLGADPFRRAALGAG
ncbi:MAG TPA: hypothetical protein VM869_07390 [Enhygromyxa sp.]|nr:hypothetical protein [Enhygromyxa sp.]